MVAHGENWLRFRTNKPHQDNPMVLQRLISAGVSVITLSEVPRSLEAVYLQIVNEDENLTEKAHNGNHA